MSEPATRCGFVALVGAPNAGKSTLLNMMVGSKVSIVTPKVQTTRSRITGICMAGDHAQIIFLDTPGIFKPKRRLERAMVTPPGGRPGRRACCYVLVRPRRCLDGDTRRILVGRAARKRRAGLALNKTDGTRRDALLPLSAKLNESGAFSDSFMISALKGDGVDDLRDFLAARMPLGPWLYPEDQLADIPLRLLAAETTREKLFLRLHQELPYALGVETESWEERKDGSILIHQVIYVLRDSHKPIILGKGGRQIKAVGQASRLDLEAFLGQRVHLFIHVKVAPKWTDDPARYRDMGLEFPK